MLTYVRDGTLAEERAINRRVDSALRLTLEWLQWRQRFTTAPLPPQPAGQGPWAQWWKDNEAHIPDLRRADDLYNTWRDNRDYTSPSTPLGTLVPKRWRVTLSLSKGPSTS